MRLTRGRIALLGALVLVLAGLATTASWAASRSWQDTARTGPGRPGYGPGMMGRGPGGMMGGYGGTMMGGTYVLPGGGTRVRSIDAARSRAGTFADRLGLHTGEVIQFDNGFYAELLATGGSGATEVLVDAGTGTVSMEHGPAMMWNTRYGMHPLPQAGRATVTAPDATRLARSWLDDRKMDLTTGEPEEFPGYYTMETLRGGRIVSMMSVNAYTGAVWYHTWHGRYIASAE